LSLSLGIELPGLGLGGYGLVYITGSGVRRNFSWGGVHSVA